MIWGLLQRVNREPLGLQSVCASPSSRLDARRNSVHLIHSQADQIIRLWLLWLPRAYGSGGPSHSTSGVHRIKCWHSADAEQMCDISRTSCADHLLCNRTLEQMRSQRGVPPQNCRLTRAISVRALQLPEPQILLGTPAVVKNSEPC